MKKNLMLCLLLLLSACIRVSHADQFNVAVAANFQPTLSAILAKFERTTGHRVRLSSASSGVLFAQIAKGAPFALFLSADALRPQKLEQQHRIVTDTRHTYALGQLAIISRQKSLTQAQLIDQMKTAKLAIANAATAPYGIAAEQLLHCWKLDDQLDTVVRGNSIGQVLHYAATKNVDMAVISHSQWPQLVDSGHATGWYLYDVPSHCYSPIEQQMVILNNSGHEVAAKALYDYLLQADTQRLIEQWGYLSPNTSP